MKTLSTTRSTIENSDPRFARKLDVDLDLLRSSLLELISLHLDGKFTSRGVCLTDLSARIANPRRFATYQEKETARMIAAAVQHISRIIESH